MSSLDFNPALSALISGEREFAEACFNAQVTLVQETLNSQNTNKLNGDKLEAARLANEFTLAQLTLRSQERQHALDSSRSILISVLTLEHESSAKFMRALLSNEQRRLLEISEGVPPEIAGISVYLKQIKFSTNNPNYASCNGISLYQLFTQEATAACAEVARDFANGLTIHTEKLAVLGKLYRQSVVESILTDEPSCEFLFFNFVINSLKTEDLKLKSDLLLTSLLNKFTGFLQIPNEKKQNQFPYYFPTPQMMRRERLATIAIVAAVAFSIFSYFQTHSY